MKGFKIAMTQPPNLKVSARRFRPSRRKGIVLVETELKANHAAIGAYRKVTPPTDEATSKISWIGGMQHAWATWEVQPPEDY